MSNREFPDSGKRSIKYVLPEQHSTQNVLNVDPFNEASRRRSSVYKRPTHLSPDNLSVDPLDITAARRRSSVYKRPQNLRPESLVDPLDDSARRRSSTYKSIRSQYSGQDFLTVDPPQQPRRRSSAVKYILQSQHTPQEALKIDGVDSLPTLFKWQAKRRGDATLFSFRDQAEASLKTVSYQDALQNTTQLARALRRFFPEASAKSLVIGVWFKKSIELHLAILASTISGAAWLPFDADAPASRVDVCLADSHACVLLCDAAHYESAVVATAGLPECHLITFDELIRLSSFEDSAAPDVPGPDPQRTAYLIYTSGSTGTPKGIEIPHNAALTFCLSERSVLETGPEDIVWQGFSPAFDMFIEEVWVSIAGGAHLAIGSRAECQDVPGLGGVSGVWSDRGVTIVNAVPTLITIMTSLDDKFTLPRAIRLLNLGGEACPPSLVNRLWHPGLRLLNTYGPSETTVTATFQELLPGEEVTIGGPLPMYHAVLLPIDDDWDASVPLSPLILAEGVEGELAIGGPCLGNGYVRRPTLTRNKFIDHPIPLSPEERLYRTGDRVRLDGNGNLVFVGRIDTQVKHRGFRIELGEIENALTTHANVHTAAVILSAFTNRLEAYIVQKDGLGIDTKDLRGSLQRLPAYMHPEAYHFITADQLPRLPSGKVNAKGLQDLSVTLASQAKERQSEKPKGVSNILHDGSELGLLLQTIGDVFQQAEAITPTSDFFEDLGGHSLAAAMLVSKLRKEVPQESILRRIALQDIYLHRTAERIIDHLLSASDSDGGISEKGIVNDPSVEEHWPVSGTSFVLCGVAQVPPLLFFFFIEAIAILGPYLVFDYALMVSNIGYAVLSAYVAFVLAPVVKATIGIVGKWLSFGVAKAGEYPLYGIYYYRWWLADHFVELIDFPLVAETPLAPALMRCLGAHVGAFSHVGTTVTGPAFDLLFIGDDAVIGRDSALSTSWVERGRLILAPVRIGSSASVGTQSVLEGGSIVEEGAEIGPMTMVPSRTVIPAGERWVGSPAQPHSCPMDVGHMRRSRPGFARVAATTIATSLTSVFVLPVLYFLPQIPSILLFEYVSIPGLWVWAETATVAVPATLIYFTLVFLELFVLRWLVLGRVKERSYLTTSFYNYRKWFVDRLMDLSLVILHPVYATLYVVPFLRSMGVKIGHRAEVSTGRGIDFELTEIGDESFLADGVFIGDKNIRANTVTLKKTKLQARAFAGNSSLVPQGTELPSNSLVGVLSIAPETPLKEGESCFGSPPVLMPARQSPKQNHPVHLLYAPRGSQIAMRLFIEGMRIILPRTILVFGLGFGVQLFYLGVDHIGAWMVFLLPAFYFFLFALPALLFTALCKWVLIGRYVGVEWPLWSVNVWKSEFITSTYETIAAPLLTRMLTGTPFLAWTFRLFGIQVGARATLLTTDITEHDVVSIGDEAVLNRQSHPQTHLFEDRVMKIGRIDIEEGGCMKTYSHALPNSSLGARSMLGSLSLLMKAESVPAGEKWEGNPMALTRW